MAAGRWGGATVEASQEVTLEVPDMEQVSSGVVAVDTAISRALVGATASNTAVVAVVVVSSEADVEGASMWLAVGRI